MTRVLVGTTLPQFSGDRARLRAAVGAAEQEGLDSVWLFDHLWPLSGGKTRPVLECWTTLAWLAASTARIRIGTLVTRSSLRNPALLAKMAATVATIAPGRLIVTLGSGDELSRDENQAFGIPYYEAPDRVGQLETVARRLAAHFTSSEVTVKTPFATVDRLPASPRPTPAPSLWLGGRSDDVLSVAARFATGWNGWGGSARRFAADAQQVLAYAGERPIELSWGGIVDSAEGAPATPGRLAGEPAAVAGALEGYVAAGARHLVLTPAGSAGGPGFYSDLVRIRERLAG